ncbi:EamA family transporter [Streptomyces sp. ISL-43]|uniref:EamA family transporter n=1 Tax=Streptomyces sp. ISL-43 TaxID=2819183 RepID=UPI001BE568CF|nr:EamA family transporter [Streptomyces sp. ISL-43]MBT2447494.1 EamA family transporter [Streptomyces sp. ISL-43]
MKRVAVIALTALAPVSWGSTYAVASELLPPDRPLFTGVMRALPAGLLLTALARTLPKGQWWWKSAVLGGLNIGAFFPLLFLSAYRLPGGVAAVLGAAGPLFVVGLAALLLGERARLRTVLVAIVGALGVSMVVLTAEAGLDLIGILAGVVSSASMGAGTVMTKRWGRPEGAGPLAMAGWQLTAGGLVIIPMAVLVEGAPPALDAKAYLGYGYMMLINTGLAYWLWVRGIGQLTATSVTLLGMLSPLTAAVIGWAALGQALSPVQVLGMVIALGATVAGQVVAGAPRPKAEPEPVSAEPFSFSEETNRNVSMDLMGDSVRR